MKLYRYDGIKPRGLNKCGNELGGYCFASAKAFILFAIPHPRHDSRNVGGFEPLECLPHEAKLHKELICNDRERLQDKNMFSFDIFFNPHATFIVDKTCDFYIAEGGFKVLR